MVGACKKMRKFHIVRQFYASLHKRKALMRNKNCAILEILCQFVTPSGPLCPFHFGDYPFFTHIFAVHQVVMQIIAAHVLHDNVDQAEGGPERAKLFAAKVANVAHNIRMMASGVGGRA